MLRSHLIRVSDWGIQRDKIKRNAFANTAKPETPKKQKIVNRRLDGDEIHALFASAAAEPGFRALAPLAKEAGASDGEAAAAINDKSARMGGHYGAGAELQNAGNRLRKAVAEARDNKAAG